MLILAIIPARGGSKGIPRKNIRLLAGKPLLQYTIEAAQTAKRLSRVVLSTDDPEIAELGRLLGVEVPFMRPPDLARDDTPTLPVLQHAVSTVETPGRRFDAICLLQPTNPLRGPETIDACVDLLEQTGADSVVSVLPVPHQYNPHWVYFTDRQGFLKLSTGEDAPIPRRQLLPPAFHREGSVYLVRRDVLMGQNSLYGRTVAAFEVDPATSVNIDSLEDWDRAEEICARNDNSGNTVATQA